MNSKHALLYLFTIFLTLPCACSSTEINGSTPKYARQLCTEALQPTQEKIEEATSKQQWQQLPPLFQQLQRSAKDMWKNCVPKNSLNNIHSFRAQAKVFFQICQQALQTANQQKWDKIPPLIKKIKQRCSLCHDEFKFP
ncbi:MAG: hypothetical protein D6805_00135 [Planctomycetota bacterium]|nr:MAG: hypothetical protein D6805_00135 [Planctomycetota bacterium]